MLTVVRRRGVSGPKFQRFQVVLLRNALLYITSARHPTIVHAVFLFLIHFQIGYHMLLLLPGCPSLRLLLLLLPILGPTFPCQG